MLCYLVKMWNFDFFRSTMSRLIVWFFGCTPTLLLFFLSPFRLLWRRDNTWGTPSTAYTRGKNSGYITEKSGKNSIISRDIPEEVLNTYCWIHSTYTVIDAFKKPPGNHQASYPGVHNSGKSPVKQVKYYQWVAFTLFFQVRYVYEISTLWATLIRNCSCLGCNYALSNK